MGLLQRAVAERIGVCEDSVHHWEMGDAPPAIRWLPAVIEFLGYDPRPEPHSTGGRLRHWREGRGMSRTFLAKTLGVDPVTLWRWEDGRRVPKDPAGLWCRLRQMAD